MLERLAESASASVESADMMRVFDDLQAASRAFTTSGFSRHQHYCFLPSPSRMHRLSSKVARPLTLARIVQNGQRRYQLPTLVGSFVAIRGYKTPTNVKFDKLLSILRNAKALEPDHAAKLVAALLVTAQSQAARDEAQKLIDQKLSHLDTAALFDRVNGYIENPPKDSFASLLTNGALSSFHMIPRF